MKRSSHFLSGIAWIAVAWLAATGECFCDIPAMVSAADNTFFLTSNGVIKATGLNTSGQLGIGDPFNRALFHELLSPSPVSQVWAGQEITYFRRSDGSLWACGNGSSGVLGNSSWNSSYSPVQVGTDTDWKSAAPGFRHVIAIKNDGTLWSWGSGSGGQLGHGIMNSIKQVPTRIGTASDWQSVASGRYHCLAIKLDGTLWAWGSNNSGQLGDGSQTNRASPVRIGSASNWLTISVGDGHSLAIRSDGSLWAWGANGSGQLGDGSTLGRSAPVRIGSGNSWKSVSAGSAHSLGQLSDNSLLAWGANTLGQLGLGDTVSRNIPTALGAGPTWLGFAAGLTHSTAIRNDGSLAVWGGNAKGQLGPAPLMATAPVSANMVVLPVIAASSSQISGTADGLAVPGQSLIAFPLTAEKAPISKEIRIRNLGTAILSISTVSLSSGFSIDAVTPLVLTPDSFLTVTVTNDATVTGDLLGTMVFNSNDMANPSFSLGLAGKVLSLHDDTDGDGLNDAAEWHLSTFGFRWNEPNPTLISVLQDNAARAGLVSESQLLTTKPGSILLETAPSTSTASIKLNLERSSTLDGFSRFGLSQENIYGNGMLMIPLAPAATFEFFRLAAEPLPSQP